MNTEQMVALIKGSGLPFSDEFLKTLSDEQLAQLITDLSPQAPDAGPDAMPPSDVPAAHMGDADPDKDKNKMADGAPPSPAVPPAPPAPSIPGGGGMQPAKITLQYADQLVAMNKRVVSINADLAAADRASKARLDGEKEQAIVRYWDEAVRAGVQLPAQEQSFKGFLRKCDYQKVQKFSDAPTLGEVTELDREAKRILAGPRVLKFGDKFPQPANAADDQLDADRRKRMLGATPYGRALLKEELAAAKK